MGHYERLGFVTRGYAGGPRLCDAGAVKRRHAGALADEVAVLAAAATLPACCRGGCQHAVVVTRAQIARQRRVELLTSEVEFGSASHRTLARAGLELAYQRVVWELDS